MPQSFAASTFDIVIAGGGTAGLVLANRLSTRQLRVAVIDAVSYNESGDPLIDMSYGASIYLQNPNATLIGNPKYGWDLSVSHNRHWMVASSITRDADEEIFLLYSALNQTKTNLVGPDGYHGLGHLDSRKDTLTIQFELRPPSSAPSPPQPTKRLKRSRKKASSKETSTRVIEIEIAQDPTALRSRNGDTGSVVWRASTELAKAVLQQHFFPPELPVFNRERLAESHCLELGAGTGVLGLALSPLLRTYTITDIKPLLPLIRKNISLNSPGWHDGSLGNAKSDVTIEELDWLALASLPSGTTRARYCPVPKVTSASDLESTNHAAWDVVFAVDCIYNPSFLPALVDVIDTVSTAGRTWVFVVAELRQEDVLREFLDLWLKTASGRWEITRVEGFLDMHFVVWVGRKRPD